MAKNPRIIAIVVLVSLGLFVFVAPQWSNRAIDGLSKVLTIQLPHVPEGGFKLGLDLQGGVHLVYEADFEQLEGVDRAEAMEGVRDVIERRVNFFGVAEPLVQVSGNDRLIVELAGITDVEDNHIVIFT